MCHGACPSPRRCSDDLRAVANVLRAGLRTRLGAVGGGSRMFSECHNAKAGELNENPLKDGVKKNLSFFKKSFREDRRSMDFSRAFVSAHFRQEHRCCGAGERRNAGRGGALQLRRLVRAPSELPAVHHPEACDMEMMKEKSVYSEG